MTLNYKLKINGVILCSIGTPIHNLDHVDEIVPLQLELMHGNKIIFKCTHDLDLCP